jgi:hypothetical protein
MQRDVKDPCVKAGTLNLNLKSAFYYSFTNKKISFDGCGVRKKRPGNQTSLGDGMAPAI